MQWNRILTEIIRHSRPGYWGNWSLDPEVAPGAVGVLDPDTGDFRGIGFDLTGRRVGVRPISQDWKMSSRGVRRKEAAAKASATGAGRPGGEIEVSWMFASEESVATQFAVQHETYLKNEATTIRRQWATLVDGAADVNFAVRGRSGISQGFGVVTSVIYASSGLNLGARTETAAFSITGSVAGVKSMLGEAEGAASFSSISHSADVDAHVWPRAATEASSEPVAVGYTFLSFQGGRLLPAWTGPIQQLRIELRNRGSYIVKATASYKIGEREQRKRVRISAGYKKVITLPLTAYDLTLDLDFVATSQDHRLRWTSPLGEWLDGEIQVDLTGFWPGRTGITLR
jgi:hypothetical protein